MNHPLGKSYSLNLSLGVVWILRLEDSHLWLLEPSYTVVKPDESPKPCNRGEHSSSCIAEGDYVAFEKEFDQTPYSDLFIFREMSEDASPNGANNDGSISSQPAGQ